MTSTIGASTASSQAGGAAGGSQSQGPTRRTFSGQSERTYSNGSAVRYSSSGAARNRSAARLSGGTPTRARNSLTRGPRCARASQTESGQARRRAAVPRGRAADASPGPNGGASRDGTGSGYGHHEAQAPPQASATASAPQALTSTSNASGPTWSIALRRSSASSSARRQATCTARFCAPSGVRARKSSCSMRSIAGSIDAASKPRACIGSTCEASVRSAISCPRPSSSSRIGITGNRCPRAGVV